MDGVYVYGVVWRGAAVPRDLASVDLIGGPVSTVTGGPVAAVVSAHDEEWVPATRRSLRAHATVVERLMEGGPVLPIRFGVVAPGSEAVADFLISHRRRLTRALDEMAGKVELRVQGKYEHDAAVREAAGRDASIRRLRDRTSMRSTAATYYERIALGEAVAAAVERIRLRDQAALAATFAPHAARVRYLAPTGTADVSCAVLVDRRLQRSLDRALEHFAAEQADRMSFEVTGPLPPWDFVDLSLADADGVPAARAVTARRRVGTRRT